MKLKNEAIKILLSNCKMIESLRFKKSWAGDKFDYGVIDVLSLKKACCR